MIIQKFVTSCTFDEPVLIDIAIIMAQSDVQEVNTILFLIFKTKSQFFCWNELKFVNIMQRRQLNTHISNRN